MRIALDIDDVIRDLQSQIKVLHPEWCGTKYNIPELRLRDIDYRHAKVNDIPTFDFTMYITSCPPWAYNDTLKWLKDNGFPNKKVIMSSIKLSTMRIYGIDILVDDKPSTFHQVNSKHDTVCYLYDQPWNRDIETPLRVHSLAEFWERVS